MRHVAPGNKWHRARDQLRGMEEYGTPCGPTCKNEWSVAFRRENFNEFLFATGDEKKWLIAPKSSVMGWYSNGPRTIIKSSLSSKSYTARYISINLYYFLKGVVYMMESPTTNQIWIISQIYILNERVFCIFRWYRRQGNVEDPWVSLSDHHSAIGRGDILYGENHYGSSHASTVLPKHNGANVYIRMKGLEGKIT